MDQRRLVDTARRTILCPRCEEEQPMRDFATLGMSPLYVDLLIPIFRCKKCSHLFAPRPESGVASSHSNGLGAESHAPVGSGG